MVTKENGNKAIGIGAAVCGIAVLIAKIIKGQNTNNKA